MKNLMKQTLRIFLVGFLFILISCTDDSEQEIPNALAFNADDNIRAAQVDNTVEGTFSIIDNAFVESLDGRSQNVTLFPECAVITIIPDGEEGVIIVNFGEGCTLNNGANVTGMITLNYGGIISGTRTITYAFENFTYNTHQVSGGGVVLRELANTMGHPQSTVDAAIVVAFTGTNITATRTGTRVAEWVEGVGSGTWLDNVYYITGNWDTQFSNGFTRSGVVTQKLVRELSCAYITSGVLNITQNNIPAIISWGEGTCDNLATIEVAGQIFEILL